MTKVTVAAMLNLPPGAVVRPPPAWQPIPASVPEAIETAAKSYLSASHAADLTYSTMLLMDRDGPGYAALYESWLSRERVTSAAMYQLKEVLGCGSGNYPVDSWLFRNLPSPGGGCELRIEAGFCPWPREEPNEGSDDDAS